MACGLIYDEPFYLEWIIEYRTMSKVYSSSTGTEWVIYQIALDDYSKAYSITPVFSVPISDKEFQDEFQRLIEPGIVGSLTLSTSGYSLNFMEDTLEIEKEGMVRVYSKKNFRRMSVPELQNQVMVYNREVYKKIMSG